MGKMNLNKLQMLRRRSEEGGGRYDEPEHSRMNYGPQHYARRPTRMRGEYEGGMYAKRMGFEEPHMNAESGYDSEPIRFGGMVAMDTPWERKGKHTGALRREDALEWVENLESGDPNKPRGGKWTMEQVKPIAQKHGFDGEKLHEFWAVMNALYADYYEVAKKFNVATPEFFGELTSAWLHDKDAVENKAAMYYECIVR